MELLNAEFIILLVKITICVLPAIFGIYIIALNEESKRRMRNNICNHVFGVTNAIAYPKFSRILFILGGLVILLSLLLSWFLLVLPQLPAST